MKTGPSVDSMRFIQNENVRLGEENETLRAELEQLHEILDALRSLQEISTAIDAQTDVVGLLDRILEVSLKTIHASDGSLLLLDDETDELVFVVSHGAVADQLLDHRIPLGEGITGWVAQSGEATIVTEVRSDARFSATVDQQFGFQTRSMISVPLSIGDKVMGALTALNKFNGEEFNEADLTLLGVVAQIAAVAMHRAEEAEANREPDS